MVDYHVDRPEVEALQGVELTGTNRSDILTDARARSRTLEVLLCTALQTSRRDRLELRLAIALGDQGNVILSLSKDEKGFWRPWRRGPTRSHPEHGS